MDTMPSVMFSTNHTFDFTNKHEESPTANSTDQPQYIYTPFGDVVLATFVTLLIASGSVGFLGNTTVLYLKWQQHEAQKHKTRRALERQIANYFIISLAVSDVYASLVAIPLFAVQKSTDLFSTPAGCKGVRFFILLAPFFTVMNLIIIGAERYLGIFYPMRSPTRKTAKRLLFTAWLLALVCAGLSMIPVEQTPYVIPGRNLFTYKCKANVAIPRNKIIFYTLTFIFYIIPSILLTYSCLAITRYIHKRQKQNHRVPESAQERTNLKAERRKLRTAQMFVTVIMTFVFPYMLFVVHLGIYSTVQTEPNIVFDFTVPLFSGVLSLMNCTVNPFLYILGSRDLKKCFKKYILEKLSYKSPRTPIALMTHQPRNNDKPQEDQGKLDSTQGTFSDSLGNDGSVNSRPRSSTTVTVCSVNSVENSMKTRNLSVRAKLKFDQVIPEQKLSALCEKEEKRKTCPLVSRRASI